MTAVVITPACRTNVHAEVARRRCGGDGIGSDPQSNAKRVRPELADSELRALLRAYFRAELDPDESTELMRLCDERHL